MKKIFNFLFLSLILWSCGTGGEEAQNPDLTITENGLADHIKTLASDEFQGRKPFSEGEEKTVSYLKEQFERLGLEPGNNGSYFQEVPLVEIDAQVTGNLEIEGEITILKQIEWHHRVLVFELPPDKSGNACDSGNHGCLNN